MSVLGYTNLLTSNSMPTTVLIATGATRGNVANVSKTFNSLTANVIIVALAYNNLGGFGILSDNLGNTYTMYNAYGGSQVFVRFFVCLNPITSATHTITYNSTNTAPGMAILVDKRSRTPIMDYFNVGFCQANFVFVLWKTLFARSRADGHFGIWSWLSNNFLCADFRSQWGGKN